MSNYNKEYYERHKKAYAESNTKYLTKKRTERKRQQLDLIVKINAELSYKGFSVEEETYLRELLTKEYNKLSKGDKECNTGLDV